MAASIPKIGWEQISPAPVVLVFGKESYLAGRALQRLRALLLLEDPELEVHDVDAGQYSDGALELIASPSLFDEPRLIRVENGVKATDAFIADALRYLAAPVDGTTLVIRHDGSTVRGKKMLDAIRSTPGAIEVVCQPLKRDELVPFVRAELRLLERDATPGAIAALVDAFASDIAELANAVRQVAQDTDGTVTEQVVRTYYAGRVETTAFAVVDAVIAGDVARALVTLRQAIATGADPVPIVAAFAMRYRQLAKVSGAGGGDGQAARQLGMQDWQVRNARRDLRGLSDALLCDAIEAIAHADAAVKGAERDPQHAVERLVRQLAIRQAA
ncbi:DNA polymerase III subunit delta [Agrococcus sediminis]|uniref:DNA polymerase III subunit delta n=1 Tax=Agrococcus TaxID=46352 RepID=UPI000FE31988|nr:DNA polymerase III subunit delta [Agrococcus sp. SCSIO52902]RWR23806.1 DNA polymerase III subunit delta [Agrococcus lahaulensis]UOW00648.1 DNA polymerase III subunit delta [Agrococcus sp. SCSIO52902]